MNVPFPLFLSDDFGVTQERATLRRVVFVGGEFHELAISFDGLVLRVVFICGEGMEGCVCDVESV